MNAIQIRGGEVLRGDVLHRGSVVVSGERIEANGSVEDALGQTIDADGLITSPGFIDLQINGGHGIDLQSGPDGLWELAEVLPRHGVTSFLPTLISPSADQARALLKVLANRPADLVGAQPLGTHLEGPMLNPVRCGAHGVNRLQPPSDRLIEGWSAAAGVALVTLAPELAGAISAVNELRRRGVAIAAGHSNATADEAARGFDAGITMVTHLFNAMAPLQHREPNLVGAALAAETIVAGLIVDGVHLDPLIVKAIWNLKGPRGIALVTDAVSAMGLPPAEYRLGDEAIISDGRAVRAIDGTLAGSVLTMDQALRHLIEFANCSTPSALRAATATPASVISASGRGEIFPGAMADLTLLDQNLEVQVTLCRGRVSFVAEAARGRVPSSLHRNEAWK